jgi:hypothetical protein
MVPVLSNIQSEGFGLGGPYTDDDLLRRTGKVQTFDYRAERKKGRHKSLPF